MNIKTTFSIGDRVTIKPGALYWLDAKDLPFLTINWMDIRVDQHAIWESYSFRELNTCKLDVNHLEKFEEEDK